jgi:ribosome biogenesis GTPase
VRTDGGDTVDAGLRDLKKSNSGKRADGSLRRDTVAAAASTLKLAVGDDVRLDQSDAGGAWSIAEILPRRSKLARRAPGGGQGERIVAANVDQVIVMFAAAKPDPHPRMLDRFLVIAEGNNIPARVIINKIDLVGEEAARARFDDYARIGYPVHYTCVKTGLGLESLREVLNGRRSVLTGPSSVGNPHCSTLFPSANLRALRDRRVGQQGRRTVGALCFRCRGRWRLSSTRRGCARSDSGPWWRTNWISASGVRGLSDQCRFADCRRFEPDCAVRGRRFARRHPARRGTTAM